MRNELRAVLQAADPDSWLAAHLARRWMTYEGGLVHGYVRVVSLAELLDGGAAGLRAVFDHLVAEGTPAPAAATYVAGWFAGGLASAVGFGLGAAGAGFLTGGPGSSSSIRFRLHPEGWPYGVELPGRAVVTSDHPWSQLDGVETANDAESVVRQAVGELVDAVGPIVRACRGMAHVGSAGLWNEVADSLGSSLAHQELVPVEPAMVETLEAAVALPGMPWRSRPSLRYAHSPLIGRVHVVQKGGCCLAYTRERDEVPRADDPGLDPDRRAYLERFPIDPAEPRYCSTCSFRTPDDCDARQVFWRERHALAGSS